MTGQHRRQAAWRIGKAFDIGWAVFSVERHPKLGELRHCVERFGTFEQARATFAGGET